MRNARCFILATAALVSGTAAMPARAGQTIDNDKFTFTSTDPTNRVANDFHLMIAGSFDKGRDPTAKPFGNVSVNGNVANFTSGSVNSGGEINVTYKSDANTNRPTGIFTFTDNQGKSTNISGNTKSKDLNGNVVAYVPNSTGGFVATLALANNFGSTVTGSVNVYVNSGYNAGLFNLDDFATLRNESQVFTASNFSLAQDQVLSTFQANLPSTDNYLLALGSVDVGDGTGPSSFAIAFSPVAIPEPASVVMLGIGLAGALGLAVWRRMAGCYSHPGMP